MPGYFLPLRQLVPDGLIPEDLILMEDQAILDLIGIRGYSTRPTYRGFFFRADLGINPDASDDTGDPVLLLALPAFPDLGLAFRSLGRLEVDVREEWRVSVSLSAFAVRLPPALLKPVRPKTGGGWEPDATREYVEVQIAYRPEDGIADPYPLTVTFDHTGRLTVAYPFAETPSGPILPRASLNGPAMVGDSGIVVNIEELALDLDLADPVLSFTRASVTFPPDLTGPLIMPAVEVTDARLTKHGFSGTVAASWPLALVDGHFAYLLPGGAQEALLFSLNGGLAQIAIGFVENRLVAADMIGGLLVPYFDEPVDVRLSVTADGDFRVTILGLDEAGITLRQEDLLSLTVRALTLASIDGVGSVSLSGELEPLLMASDGLLWPSLDVTDLLIDTTGRFQVREAWMDLKSLATLDLFGFHFELSRIGLGCEEGRDRLWLDLSGSLRLIEQIPVGLDVQGFRLSWPRTLLETLGLDQVLAGGGSLSPDDALAVLAQLEVQFAGIELFFGVPDAVEFQGLIRFFKDATIVGFAGDVALRVPSSGFALEAGLMVGMNFEAPPYPFLYVYVGVELPAGIPLGQSGLALKGALGLFGLNVSPARSPEENWYHDWYKRGPIVGAHPTNKWKPERGAFSLGVGLTVTTVDGIVKGVRGLLVLSIPGPILIIEGRALLFQGLGPGEPPLRALAVFDGKAQTVQFNLEAQAELVADLLEAYGGIEAFFDFKDLTNWHLYLGEDEPKDRRVLANILKAPGSDGPLFEADAYLMLDMVGETTVRTRLGAFVSIEQRFDDYDPVRVDLSATIEANGLITLFPEQFSAQAALDAQVSIRAFGFGVQLAAGADVLTEGPDPLSVDATLTVTADLPNPLPDFDSELRFAWTAPSPPPLVSPLVGVVANSDFAPGGGGLEVIPAVQPPPDLAATLRGTLADVRTSLADNTGRLGAAAARDAADLSVVVPVDARPTLLFADDMNEADDFDGEFGRDGDGSLLTRLVGRIALTQRLFEVALYEHPKGAPWSDDPGLNEAERFDADWTPVALATALGDTEPLDALRFWGIWLSDTSPQDPVAPAARRLRLWTANPLIHARGSLGSGYQRIFGLDGPRLPVAEERLRDRPDAYACGDAQPAELCVQVADIPDPQDTKAAEDGNISTSRLDHAGVSFTATGGPTNGLTLERHAGPPPTACLSTRGRLTIHFPMPAMRVRLRFCVQPGLSPLAARGRLTAHRSADLTPVVFDVAVDGLIWTIDAPEGLDYLEITRPARLASVCFVTDAEAERAGRALQQCETKRYLFGRLDEPARLLQPGSYYRIIVKSATDVDLVDSDQDPAVADAIAAAMDIVYTEAFKALIGLDIDGGRLGYVQEAFFQTEGPPTALAPYVKWSSPELAAPRVCREDDVLIRFRRSHIRAMFEHTPFLLEVLLRDSRGARVPGLETVWLTAPCATLLPEEETWLAHLNALGHNPVLPPDDILAARRTPLLAAESVVLGTPGWSAVDIDVAGAPSTPGVRPGRGHAMRTARVLLPEPRLSLPADVVFEATVSAPGGEVVGIVFRWQDERNHYRVTLGRGARRLVRIRDGIVTVLAETPASDDPSRPHDLHLEIRTVVPPVASAAVAGGAASNGAATASTSTPAASTAARIVLEVDGRPWPERPVVDVEPLQAGTVGLYAGRPAGAAFSQVGVLPADSSAGLAPNERYEALIVGGEGGALLLAALPTPPADANALADGEMVSGAAPQLFGEQAWTDLDMIVEIEPADDAPISIVFRHATVADPDADGVPLDPAGIGASLSGPRPTEPVEYRVVLDRTGRQWQLVRRVGSTITVLDRRAYASEDDVSPLGEWVRLRVQMVGHRLRVWRWDEQILTAEPARGPLQGRVGLSAEGIGARFRRLRVREAALYRLPFSTGPFGRFRGIAATFAGSAIPLTLPAWDASALTALAASSDSFVTAARAWERAQPDFRDERLDRAGLEARRLELRDARALLDETWRATLMAAGLPLFDPPPASLEVFALKDAADSVVGLWIRSPEGLDPRRTTAGEHVGRTEAALLGHVAGVGSSAGASITWEPLAAHILANADGTELLILPSGLLDAGGPSAWSASWYRLVLTYHRDHDDEPAVAPCDSEATHYARPIRSRLGSAAPETAVLEWPAPQV